MLEATVMEVLWHEGEANVRKVVDRLGRRLAYTTVMTTLDRLYKKRPARTAQVRPRLHLQISHHAAGMVSQTCRRFCRELTSERDLVSCFVDEIGQHEALLVDLEEKIRFKRASLSGIHHT
ncbi:MAG: hypothetical protein C5B58_05460 [Acidobacteria bacterium]|nr:MAG: hypothetical protein C5B58_05460 [Acidobacteriota bacterium]